VVTSAGLKSRRARFDTGEGHDIGVWRSLASRSVRDRIRLRTVPYASKEDQLRYQRSWDKEHYREKKVRQIARRRAQRKKFEKLKATLKCSRCPENHPATLDFHHKVAKSKEASLGDAIARMDWGWEKILREIAKCEVLCSNCHRKEHHGV